MCIRLVGTMTENKINDHSIQHNFKLQCISLRIAVFIHACKLSKMLPLVLAPRST